MVEAAAGLAARRSRDGSSDFRSREGNRQTRSMPYGALLDQVEAGNVASMTFDGTEVDGRFKHPLRDGLPTGTSRRDSFRSRVPDFGDPALIPELRKEHVAIDVRSPSQWASLLARLPWPMLVFVALILVVALVRIVRGAKAGSRCGHAHAPGRRHHRARIGSVRQEARRRRVTGSIDLPFPPSTADRACGIRRGGAVERPVRASQRRLVPAVALRVRSGRAEDEQRPAVDDARLRVGHLPCARSGAARAPCASRENRSEHEPQDARGARGRVAARIRSARPASRRPRRRRLRSVQAADRAGSVRSATSFSPRC